MQLYTPRVSVVMPVYNCRATLPRAINSIRNQTLTDWELIIVDDASLDNSAEVCRRYMDLDSRIKFLQNTINGGCAKAINYGIKRSGSPYIARMDSDDFSHPERLARQLDFMAENPGVDVLGCNAEFLDEQGNKIGTSSVAEDHEIMVKSIHKRCPFIHPTVMMRRDFLVKNQGYRESLKNAQDYDLWLRGCRQSRYHNLPDILFTYTARGKTPFRQAWLAAEVILEAVVRGDLPRARLPYALRPLFSYLLEKSGLYPIVTGKKFPCYISKR